MSFALTKPQFLDGTKTETRRLGWQRLRPGEEFIAVEKAMGLKRGESPVHLGRCRVVSVVRELLNLITQDAVISEGFQHMTPTGFVAMFCEHMGCEPEDYVTVIRFEKVAS